jgi:hypothetical protein
MFALVMWSLYSNFHAGVPTAKKPVIPPAFFRTRTSFLSAPGKVFRFRARE